MRRSRSLTWLLAAVLALLNLAAAMPVPVASPSVQAFVEPAAHLSPVLSLIRQARHSIRLEVYLLTNRSVVLALRQARSRGVSIRVLLEEHPYGAGRYASSGYDLLRSDGISVRWANERAFTYTHEKAMVIDGHIAGIFTFNLSSSGVYSNREFGVIDTNASDAGVLAAIFDADWNRRAVRFASSRLVISPINSRHDFQTLIDGARHTLDVYAEEIDDASIEGHLIAARRRHVRVRLITSDDSPGVETLRSAGIKVALMPSPYVHAKAMVADGSRVFIGSENISATSLDANREAGIELSDRTVANVVERTFASDWRANAPAAGAGNSGSPPPPPQSNGSFSVRVSASPTTVSRGQTLTITAATSPNASCTIRVTYPDGYVSRARALQSSRTADAGGTITWSWHEGSTLAGTGHAAVTCSLAGKTSSGSVAFQIE